MNDLESQHNNELAESARRHRRTGKHMILISWLFILAICFVVFSWLERAQMGAYNTTTSRTASGGIQLSIPLTNGDNYQVFGSINDTKVLFLVDTGASMVSVPTNVAIKAGLRRGMPITILTAGGTKTAYLTKIPVLKIGDDITLRNVNATINPEMGDETVLLGMGALKQLQFIHTTDTLIITQE